MLRILQSDVGPSFPTIGGFVNSIPVGDVAADACFAGPDIDDVGIGVGHGDSPDRGNRFFIEEWCPAVAAVRGAPDPSGNSTEVKGRGVSGHTGHCQNTAAAVRPDGTP